MKLLQQEPTSHPPWPSWRCPQQAPACMLLPPRPEPAEIGRRPTSGPWRPRRHEAIGAVSWPGSLWWCHCVRSGSVSWRLGPPATGPVPGQSHRCHRWWCRSYPGGRQCVQWLALWWDRAARPSWISPLHEPAMTSQVIMHCQERESFGHCRQCTIIHHSKKITANGNIWTVLHFSNSLFPAAIQAPIPNKPYGFCGCKAQWKNITSHLDQNFACVLALGHVAERLLHVLLIIDGGVERSHFTTLHALPHKVGHCLPVTAVLREQRIQQDAMETDISQEQWHPWKTSQFAFLSTTLGKFSSKQKEWSDWERWPFIGGSHRVLRINTTPRNSWLDFLKDLTASTIKFVVGQNYWLIIRETRKRLCWNIKTHLY